MDPYSPLFKVIPRESSSGKRQVWELHTQRCLGIQAGLEKQEGEGLCVLWASTAAWFWGMEGQEPNNAEKCREKGWATQWNDAECSGA